MHELTKFIETTKDARELKRALAVKMTLHGSAWTEVMDVLQVSHAFISKWRRRYACDGIASLRVGYRGSVGYLASERKQQVLAWLNQQTTWSVSALQQYVKQTYEVEYASKQSYYALMAQARISWKQSQARNPKRDPEEIAAKRAEIQKKLPRR